MIKKIFLFSALVFFLAIPQLVRAQSIEVSPVYQEVTLNEKTGMVVAPIILKNTTQQPLTFEVFPTQADQVDSFGNISLEQFSGASNESLPYISFSQDRFSLEPGSQASISAVVSDRASLKPGGSYVGVVFRVVSEEQENKQVVQPAVVTYLLISKPGGALRSISLKKVFGIPYLISMTIPKKISLEFSNEGNIHVRPRGTIEVTDSLGRLIAQSTVNESSQYVLPGRIRLLNHELKLANIALPVSFLSLKIFGNVPNSETTYQYESSFIYINPWLIVSAFFILLFSILIILWRKKKHEA